MRDRPAFTAQFVLCLAIAAGAFFAWHQGIPQLVWANSPAGYFGLAITALFVWTASRLLRQAWHVDAISAWNNHAFRVDALLDHGDTWTAHLAVLLFPSIGFVGTVAGLSLSFKAAGVNVAALMAGGSTAFYSTGCGLVAMILMSVMVGNLDAAIRRASR